MEASARVKYRNFIEVSVVEIFIKCTESGVFTKNFLSSSLGKFSVFVFKVGKGLVKLAFVVL